MSLAEPMPLYPLEEAKQILLEARDSQLQDVCEGILKYGIFRDDPTFDIFLAWTAQGHLRKVMPLNKCFFLFVHGSKSSGKSVVTEIGALLGGGRFIEEGSLAAMERIFNEADKGIIWIDEIPSNNRRLKFDLEGILRVADSWDATYDLCNTEGKITVEALKVGGPKIFNGRGSLEDALLSRGITIEMPRVLDVNIALDNYVRDKQLGGIVSKWKAYCLRKAAKWSNKKSMELWHDPAFRERVKAFPIALGRDYGIAAHLLIISEILDLEIEESIRKVMQEKQEQEESFDLYKDLMRDLYIFNNERQDRDWAVSVGDALEFLKERLSKMGLKSLSQAAFKRMRPELGFEEGINVGKDRRQQSGKYMMTYDANVRKLLGIGKEEGKEGGDRP